MRRNPYTRRAAVRRFNPLSLVFVAFLTCVGALLGSWLAGLTVGLGLVIIATVLPD